MTRYAARPARIPGLRKRATVLGRTPRSVALQHSWGMLQKAVQGIGLQGWVERWTAADSVDGRGQMEPGLHGDLSYVAANPGDTAIQRYSSVPGGSLHLHSQHPDAA